jgi:hypothetical protein
LFLIFFNYLLSAFTTQAPLGSRGYYFNHSISNLLCSISLVIKELDIISYSKVKLVITDLQITNETTMKTKNYITSLLSILLNTSLIVLIPLQLNAQWLSDPTVNTAVCKQSDAQDGSCAVSDGQGGAIVAWLDNRDSKRRVYAQRLSAAGIPQWTPDGVLICTHDGGKQDLVIVSDGIGGAILAWQDYRNDPNFPVDPVGDIFGQRIDAAGNIKWVVQGEDICTAQGNQSFPAIVGDGSGGGIITWMDGRTGNDHVYAQRMSAGGYIQWATNGIAICEQGYYLRYPDIASDGPGGGAIITWQDQRVYDAYDIYAQRINAAGVVQWTKDGVVVCNAGGQQSDPVIVLDALGGAVIAWDDTRNNATTGKDIYAQRLNASGQPQWTANGKAICTSSGIQSTPAIATDGTGGAVITWYDGNFDIYAQRIHGNGNTLWTANGVAICTEGSWQWFPRIIADDFNGAVITWEDKRSGDWDIYGMRIDGNGNPTWNTNGLAISRPQYDQTFSNVPPIQHGDNHIVKAGSCGAIVVWNDGRANSGDIYAQRVYCEGTLGGEEIIIDVPNGGESWNVGSTRYITWHTKEFSGNVNILASYSGYNPQFWVILATNETNDGSFEWVVPNNPSGNCVIRIADADDEQPYDISDAVFAITGGGGSSFIKVDVPDGGENWQIGSQHNIVWHTQSYSGPVRIEYSTDGGAGYTTIENSYAGSPPYTWTIPNAASTSCAVKISDPTDADPFDISDGVFTISTGGAGTSSITVDIPNGGEDWTVGSKHYIVWHTQNYTGPVNIEYSDDGGANYTAIESSYTGSSSYEWTVPNTPSTNCVMRVAEPSLYNPVDISNLVFTISAGSSGNTSVGQNILVSLGSGHTIQFNQVTQEGNTELIVLPEGPQPPEGYVLFPAASPLFYDIITTATYLDTISLVLQYDDASITEEKEAQLNLFHYNEDAEQWEQITTGIDTESNLIAGITKHLSLFAIMLPMEVEEPVGYVVTNTQDSGEGSMRQVLLDASIETGVAMITFQIPKTDPGFNADTGVWTIKLQSEFSSIQDKYIIIDGTSQSQFIGEDTNPFGPEIEINGESAGENAQGLFFYNCAVEITHLIINRFSDAGILLWKGPQAMIAGCYIGTGPTGMEKAGNNIGIAAADNCKHINIVPLDTIPNVISGNDNGGISLWDTCTNSLIAGNIIGLNRTKTEAVGGNNGPGITFLRCDSITIVENWIGGNNNGIGLWQCSDNIVAGNKIGTDPEWTNDLTNSGDGIEIGHASLRNRIMGNFIGNNSRDGIRITGSLAIYNTISENSISMNDGEGINLVNGANGGIATPIITSVLGNEIFGTALPMSIIEIYTDNKDEGRIIQAVVMSDPAGNWGWAGDIQGSFDSIRVTATDTLGNTSEFGRYVPQGPTSIRETRDPIAFTLSQNFAGSAHAEIQVGFDLPGNSEVSLDVYNLGGVKVAEIHNGKLQAGYQSMTWNTSRHAAGVYLIRLQTRMGALTKKCVVLK